MTYPPAQPPAPPAPTAVAPVPPSAPKRGLPWWGWLLIALGAVGIVSTGVFTAQAMSALVTPGGLSQGPAPSSPGSPEEPADSGVVYESADFPFEVTFPGEPTREVVEQAVAGFDLELIVVTWTGGGRYVAASSTEFPMDFLPGGVNDDVLQGSLAGAAGNTGGTITDQEFIELAGERAISGTVASSGTTLFVTVLFHDSVQYSLISQGGTLADHEAYLASFRFTD